MSLVSNWQQCKSPTSANDSAARANFSKLAKRKKLKPEDCRFIVARGTDFADALKVIFCLPEFLVEDCGKRFEGLVAGDFPAIDKHCRCARNAELCSI